MQYFSTLICTLVLAGSLIQHQTQGHLIHHISSSSSNNNNDNSSTETTKSESAPTTSSSAPLPFSTISSHIPQNTTSTIIEATTIPSKKVQVLAEIVQISFNTTSNSNVTANNSASGRIKDGLVASSYFNASRSPRSERQPILDMFAKFFTKARSHDDQGQKEFVRDGVIKRLRELGFETSFLQKSRFEFRRKPAFSYNMISILPGKFRQTKHDRIVLVGAHWDSATKAPGVDDNGSGSTCLLEIARLISLNRCSFNHTVMLVWFDYEEQGKYGSEFFVNDYLFPYELEKYQSKFIGAYIMDMILVRDKENGTQTLPPNLKTKLTDIFEELEREKNRGDFLATWSRKTFDEPLENAFRSSWIDLGYESRTFKAMRPELPQARLPNADERYEWKDFFRSDHASFWFPPLTSAAVRRSPNRTSAAGHSSLNAILLTDLGPWRRSYSRCYHSPCDDEHLLTDDNLSFMQQVIDALVLTLMRVGQGECRAANNGAPPAGQSAFVSEWPSTIAII